MKPHVSLCSSIQMSTDQRVQQRTAKMVRGMEEIKYKGRLRTLGFVYPGKEVASEGI